MRRLALVVVAAGALGAPAAAPAQSILEPVDCAAPAAGSFDQREAENAWCATQREADAHSNPLYHAAQANRPASRRTTAMDPMREPTLLGHRFRFEEVRVTGSPAEYPGMLFRPPSGEGPWPGVVIMHGGAANQEMYLWAAEGLAEAGYMVLTVNLDSRLDNSHYEAARAGLDWLTSLANPHRGELDASRIGLAGHSAGGVAVSRLGQEDARVSAIASWDRAQSSTMPAELTLRTPAAFFTADYNCQRVPVCLPQPYSEPPDPLGPGNKDEDFRRLRSAGVDTMKVALRASVHLDWTEWPELNGSRYGTITTLYFTKAWFDRYLKGDPAATARLTAERFDDSADVHSISTGTFDPFTTSNVPPLIQGHRIVDRLSFHFRSGYWLEGGALACEDWRTGC